MSVQLRITNYTKPAASLRTRFEDKVIVLAKNPDQMGAVRLYLVEHPNGADLLEIKKRALGQIKVTWGTVGDAAYFRDSGFVRVSEEIPREIVDAIYQVVAAASDW